jgi:DNA-binding beta-propeller fold protein YncE
VIAVGLLRSVRLSVAMGAVACVIAVASVAAAPAAADSIYWSNVRGNRISFANLNGSGGGGDLKTGLASVDEPFGLTIDLTADKIYWANIADNTISFASLDGSGGGDLNTSGATVSSPWGIAVDPALGKIYWANNSSTADKISFANLNGTGGGDLNTSGATVDRPEGVAIDPATGRIYWANFAANKISFANLNGSGGGNVATGMATVKGPSGVGLDVAGGKIYWANSSGDRISVANLNGTGGQDINTGTATLNDPDSVAVDTAGGKIYWGNFEGNKISFADLRGIGGGDLNTGNGTVSAPAFPALLKSPSGVTAPPISGGPLAPTTISCSQGSWAPDLLGSFLYQAPQSFSFSWTFDGALISGATGSSITARSAGVYRCRVTATNFAGSTTQTSAPLTVSPLASPPATVPSPPPPPAPPTAIVASVSPAGARQSLTLRCHGVSGQECVANVVGTVKEKTRAGAILAVAASKEPKNHGGKPKTRVVTVTVVRVTLIVPAGGSSTATLALNDVGKSLLAHFHPLPVNLTFSGSMTGTRTVVFTIPSLHVNTPPDDWFHINLPCGDCYTRAQHVPLTGLPAGARVLVTCHGGGCPYAHRTFAVHQHQFDLAPALQSSHLQPGTVVEVLISAPAHAGVIVQYAVQRGAAPLRSLCPRGGAGGAGRCP